MKRKFNIGDFVIVNEKSRNPDISEWLKYSPLGVGVVYKMEPYYRDWHRKKGKRWWYGVKCGETFLETTDDTFYSWELDLVSKSENRNKTSKNT